LIAPSAQWWGRRLTRVCRPTALQRLSLATLAPVDHSPGVTRLLPNRLTRRRENGASSRSEADLVFTKPRPCAPDSRVTIGQVRVDSRLNATASAESCARGGVGGAASGRFPDRGRSWPTCRTMEQAKIAGGKNPGARAVRSRTRALEHHISSPSISRLRYREIPAPPKGDRNPSATRDIR
jgi:hypothetical protein